MSTIVKGELRFVNRLMRLSGDSSFGIAAQRIPEWEKQPCIMYELEDNGLFLNVLDEDSCFHPDRLGYKLREVVKPGKEKNIRRSILRIPKHLVKEEGWTSPDVSFLSLFEVIPKKRYYLCRSTPEEIQKYAYAERNIVPGLWRKDNRMMFSKEQRDAIGLKYRTMVQCELNLKDGNFIKIRRLREGETPFPLLSKTDVGRAYKDCYFSHYDPDTKVEFSTEFQSGFRLPSIFVKANNMKYGDMCNIFIDGDSLVIEGPEQVCSVCGKSYHGKDTKMVHGHICGGCSTVMPSVTRAIQKNGSIKAAAKATKIEANVTLDSLHARISKQLIKLDEIEF